MLNNLTETRLTSKWASFFFFTVICEFLIPSIECASIKKHFVNERPRLFAITVSLKYSPLKVHLVECISESHSAVDRRCHTDVDELPYFGNTVKGREELLRPGVTQAHLLLCLCSFSFTLWVKKGAVPAGTLGCPGEGEGASCSALSSRAPANRHPHSRRLCERERGKRGRLTGTPY